MFRLGAIDTYPAFGFVDPTAVVLMLYNGVISRIVYSLCYGCIAPAFCDSSYPPVIRGLQGYQTIAS